MEYVEGPSCADLLREHKLLDDRGGGARSSRDACHGLDYAHRAGVVHRDVKPGNLLIAEETGTTKLADFGIAKAAEQTRITQVGSVLGTAAYLSPEQARGEEAGPAVGHLLARRLRLPVPRRPAAARVRLAHRAGAEAAAGRRSSRSPSCAPRCRPSSTRRSGSASSASRTAATPSALEMAQALEAGLPRRGHRGHARARARADTGRHARHAASRTPRATRAIRSRPAPIPPRAPRTMPPRPRGAPDALADDARDAARPARRRSSARSWRCSRSSAAIGAGRARAACTSSAERGRSRSSSGDVQEQIDGAARLHTASTRA